jgi:hypothetical protein
LQLWKTIQIIFDTCKNINKFISKEKKLGILGTPLCVIVQSDIPMAKRCGGIFEFKSFMPQMQLVLTLLTNDGLLLEITKNPC